MFSLLNVFRFVAFLEGLSYILLLGIAVPIKYIANDPQYVKLLGMPHGVLFIAYIALAFTLKPEQPWSKPTFYKILVASIIPFGTVYIDRQYLKQA